MKKTLHIVLLVLWAAVTRGQYITSSNLPIVIINTDNGASIPDEPKIGATMKILYVNDTTINYLSNQDDPTYLNYNGRIGIECRGSTSQGSYKKPYGFETRMDDDITNNNVSLMGLPAENDWVLTAMNDEPSYVRDCLSYYLASKLGHYAPRTKYCEVIVNGDYRGLYFLTEKIKVDKDRVNIAQMDATDNQYPNVSGGYIIKADKLTGGNVPAWTTVAYDYWQDVAYIYHAPKPEEITSEQGNYIQAYFDTIQALVAAHNQNVNNGYPAYLDVPTFVDFMIMGELSSNVDVYQFSTFFHKDRKGKFRAGPVWDFNLTYGYDFGSVGRSRYDVLQFDNGDNIGSKFWRQLYEDEIFRCYLFHRWQDVTAENAALCYENVTQVMDSLIERISASRIRDRLRWFQFYNYNDHINTMKSWLQNRYAWLNDEWAISSECIPEELPPLVISKINYHPTSQQGFNADDLEFIGIVNNSDDTVDASGFYFRELGLTYTFPENALIAPHEEIFLVSNAVAFQQCYDKTAFGTFTRHLDNKSEHLVLADAWGNVIDEVTYADVLPWPLSADGHGDFLILIDPNLDNKLPESWMASNVFVSIPDRQFSPTLTISPNPTTGLVRIECEKPLKRITITDMQGRVLLDETAEGNTAIINITNYPSGVYIIKAINCDGETQMGKIVKK